MDKAVILIVDDEARNVALAQDVLEDDGYTVLGATNSQQALEMARAQPVDLALVDVMMPDTDGFGLLTRLRAPDSGFEGRVIMVSARTRFEDKVKGLELGADDYITKPYHPAELAARVKANLRSRNGEAARLEQAMRVADKMETLAAMASSITHNANNLLMSISGYASLAQLEKDPALRHEHLSRVLDAVKRMGKLFASVSEFSRGQTGEARVFSLSDTARAALDFIQPTLPRNISLKRHIETEGLFIKGDPEEMRHVIFNLITNAIHAIGKGEGVITVRLAPARVSEQTAQAAGLAPGVYLTLTVADTGCGVPPDLRSKIFLPFFTTKREGQHKGTGVGLAHAAAAAAAAGGAITLESEAGKGSEFTVYLPRFDAPAEKPAPRVEEAPAIPPLVLAPNTRGAFLVIDEDPEVRQLLTGLLAHKGYEVVTAVSGDEGVARLKERRFDLVVTDLSRGPASSKPLFHIANLRITSPAAAPKVIALSTRREARAAGELGAEIMASGRQTDVVVNKTMFNPTEFVSLVSRVLAM
ncbi:MAG: response regulator [Nitrospinae bacterium]|nr:response regulator [Nitrospinota bacterium]